MRTAARLRLRAEGPGGAHPARCRPRVAYDPRAECGAIADKVAPVVGEPVVVKHYPNSFVGTELDGHLKAAGVKNLVIVGFMTHMCINSTARGASTSATR